MRYCPGHHVPPPPTLAGSNAGLFFGCRPSPRRKSCKRPDIVVFRSKAGVPFADKQDIGNKQCRWERDARQNPHRNQVLFDAAGADLIMQPTLVSARRILFLLTAPLLRTFFEKIRESQLKGHGDFLSSVVEELHNTVGGEEGPRLWTVRVDDEQAPAAARLIDAGATVSLRDIPRDPTDKDQRLPCVPLVIRCLGGAEVMPDIDHPIRRDDEILFCAQGQVYRLLNAAWAKEYTLRYLMTGLDEPRGIITRRLVRRLSAPTTALSSRIVLNLVRELRLLIIVFMFWLRKGMRYTTHRVGIAPV